MTQQQHPMVQLLDEDPRFSLEAYQFIREALSYGQNTFGCGDQGDCDEDDMPDNPFLAALTAEALRHAPHDDDEIRVEQHLTGQQLCEAIRLHAVEQYGLMAKVVLNSWGVQSTSDFGEIVYNLIRVGWLKESENDRREDFDGCYDFREVFEQQFEFSVPSDRA